MADGKSWRLALAIGLAATLLCAASPPPSAPAADPEGTVVDELVVTAKTPGPAWWRVSHDGSTVWVLGMPGGLPRGVKWNTAGLAMHLTGARRLITPTTYSAGLGDLFGALALRGKLKTSAPIEPSLPPDLRARFVADSAALNHSPAHYDSWKPVVAGLLMLGDFRKHAGVDDFQPLATARNLAARKGVRVTPAASYKVMPVLRTLAGELTDAVNLACLTDSLQEIEAGSARVHAAAAAWASGDVRGALGAERGFEKCLASFPQFTATVRQAMAADTDAIADDLRTPGVSVAVMPLRSLVARDGVLSQLAARGYDVHTPATE